MAKLKAPRNGVRVRMYRQGHGDCFLLTMRGQDGDAFHVLIDCGFKPGSEITSKVEDVIKDIVEATGGHIDILVVTHEHQDHVNLFTAKLDDQPLFDAIDVEQLWLGWTANPKDELADKVRKGHDEAVGMLRKARKRLGAQLDKAGLSAGIDEMLALEGFGAAGKTGISKATTERSVAAAMRYLTAKVPDEKKRKYFLPHEAIDVAGVPGLRVISLGPPRSRSELNKDEPKAAGERDRVYDKGHGLSFGFSFGLGGLLPASETDSDEDAGEDYMPFAAGHSLRGKGKDPNARFFEFLYGKDDRHPLGWRRIERDWLFALDWFARKINVEVNNSSLVLALELTASRKVLLFAGDAQYGNWLSWDDRPIKLDDGSSTTVQELLGRTVLYKVGHHGSHNATLKGTVDSGYANLDWLGRDGVAKDEFVAMIPANEPWALAVKPDPWVHPLPAIRAALDEKAKGRVFQSNIDFAAMKREGGSQDAWDEFVRRSKGSSDLYFDYWVPDE